jgi:hypothetical protein
MGNQQQPYALPAARGANRGREWLNFMIVALESCMQSYPHAHWGLM